MRIFHSHSVSLLCMSFIAKRQLDSGQSPSPVRLKVPAHLATLGFSLSQIPVDPASKYWWGLAPAKLHNFGETSTYSFFVLYMGVDNVHL